jgi:hypothetical protein
LIALFGFGEGPKVAEGVLASDRLVDVFVGMVGWEDLSKRQITISKKL